ncbi:MAG TPA: hypothetical protein PL110_10640 [Candidatus Eremiobacteraeota bacterium]|nr:MAG: hypothetical protein BWY64_01366 [bacterium ADurb.Bin363]HPZ08560.1 hypothetical protein [Candidatus Eremiobacteraeota bacterium]
MIKYIILIFVILNIILNSPCNSKENFEAFRGWNVVKMNMTVEEVKKALKEASISFEEKMFHKTGNIYLTLDKKGWKGTIYFDEKNRVNQILFQSPYIKSEKEVKKIRDSFIAQYGSPHETKEIPLSDDGRRDIYYIWKNKFIMLELTVTYYNNEKEWILWECYNPVK